MTIIKASIEHVDDLVALFDAYRMFYRQESNIPAAKQFLFKRINNNESVIYMAYRDKRPVGFMQLYPLFSSVSMEPMYLLNDLYVDADYRSTGLGKALINTAKVLCKERQFKGLGLQTEITNKAQHLYERLGFVKDPDLHYFWTNLK